METTVYGKWILTGEHAVLRGCPALVFPVLGRSLQLSHQENGKDISVDFLGPHGDELRLLFWGVIERGLELSGIPRARAQGQFRIESSIPVGAGLGASAALCVAIGRWFQAHEWVEEKDLAEFCRQLENLFHGESSGVDIAVALSAQGLQYERGHKPENFTLNWSPDWYISYSGKRGVTSECVAKVKALWMRDERLGAALDRDMREATLAARAALTKPSSDFGFEALASAINKARGCFERWGLASGEIGSHIQHLVNLGAYAVKPTGSGDGGYVLSLWRTPPPASIGDQLIPLTRPN